MITAVVLAEQGLGALVSTLTALVTGAAQGLVADAVVVTRHPRDELAAVAEALGATFLVTLGDPWFAAAGNARQDWLLCLEAGDVPTDGWIDAVGRVVASPNRTRLAAFSRRPASLRARCAALQDAALGASRVRAGFLVHRAILTERRLTGRIRPVRLPATIERQAG